MPVWKLDLLATCYVPERFYGFRLTGFNNQILDLRGDYTGPYMPPTTVNTYATYGFAYQLGYSQIGQLSQYSIAPVNTADSPYDPAASNYGNAPPPVCYFDGDNVYLTSPGYCGEFVPYGSPLPTGYTSGYTFRNKGYHAHISNIIAGNITVSFSTAIDFDDCVLNVNPPGNDLVGVEVDYYPSHGGYILGYGGDK